MRTRLYSALIGLCLPLLATTGPVEARLEKAEGVSQRQYDSVARPKAAKSYKARSGGRYAYAKRGKKYAKGASGRRYAKSGKRQRSASRGASASRGCLSAAARSLLGRIESNFGPVQLVSTCRPGAVIAGSGRPSRHRNGNAIDFNAGGRKGAIVSWLTRNHHSGGTMTYRGMSHVHVDIGPRFVKLNAGGRKA